MHTCCVCYILNRSAVKHWLQICSVGMFVTIKQLNWEQLQGPTQTLVQWLVLLTLTKKVPGQSPGWALCGVLSKDSSLLPQSKDIQLVDMHWEGGGGVDQLVILNACLTVRAPWLVGGLSGMYPASHTVRAGKAPDLTLDYAGKTKSNKRFKQITCPLIRAACLQLTKCVSW